MAALGERPSVLSIPQELTEQILKYCEPRDFARLAATCKLLRNIIYNQNDQVVWRVAYLALFDDPRNALRNPYAMAEDPDWRGELQRRIRAENVFADREHPLLNNTYADDLAGHPAEDQSIRDALNTLISAVASVPPGCESTSDSLAWVEGVLLNSLLSKELAAGISSRSDAQSNPDSTVQLVSQLWTYFALAHEDGASKASEERLNRLRTASRCFVYDLRKYRAETAWGPFLRDARGWLRVNWEHVRHIQNVVLMNLRDFPESWKKVWPEWGIQATRPYSAPGVEQRKPWDWAGVDGKWRRVVCFMDYRLVRLPELMA